MAQNNQPASAIFSINLTDMLGETERQARAAAKQQMERAAMRHIDQMFSESHPYRNGKGQIVRDRGFVLQMLIEKIDAYALSEDFEKHIQASIERHMDTEADDAVKKMLNSASRKRVFSAVPHE